MCPRGNLRRAGEVFRVVRFLLFSRGCRAGVAQLVEHLICNQRVGGSNPFASSNLRNRSGGRISSGRKWSGEPSGSRPGLSSAVTPPRCILHQVRMAPDGVWCLKSVWGSNDGSAQAEPALALTLVEAEVFEMDVPGGVVWMPGCWAQVAERLMAADCKSATHSSYGGSNPPLCTTI